MEQPQTLPVAAKQLPRPNVIPFFNLQEREEIFKRRRSTKLSFEEAKKINRARQARIIGKAALKFYNNKTEDANYELVDDEANRSNWFFFRPELNIFLHASFRAKMADDASGKTKLFFAEATKKKDDLGIDVLKCCIIDESDVTNFTRGCIHCSERIIHPTADKYTYGNSIIVNGCGVTIDFNKISLEQFAKLERSGGLTSWTQIDGFSECGKLVPHPTLSSGSSVRPVESSSAW
ncbi:hypothetical protein LINGRAHAP2_LOCUS25773 [Linum grandiflorum]